MDTEGRRPVIVAAQPGRDTTEEVRRRIHDLLITNDVRPWDITVLTGSAATSSDVWRRRTFGEVQLWNGAIDDEGRSLGLPADQVPDLPSDAGVVRFETVRRFKGLESHVVILCELPVGGSRENELLYTALTRATAHLIVIAPPALAGRLSAAASGVAR
jgi:superfamily I DNA/RNA helicase